MTDSKKQRATQSKAGAKNATTKKAQLSKLLSSKAGADIATLSAKLGWQHHTTRAAMSGLRKAGFTILGSKPSGGGPARFRIHSSPAEQSATASPEASHGT